jgi:hypothetical protein
MIAMIFASIVVFVLAVLGWRLSAWSQEEES